MRKPRRVFFAPRQVVLGLQLEVVVVAAPRRQHAPLHLLVLGLCSRTRLLQCCSGPSTFSCICSSWLRENLSSQAWPNAHDDKHGEPRDVSVILSRWLERGSPRVTAAS
eukprot:scaffold4858_cov116-Isochrysis_galbana.AAC.1